jgi:HSP20 family protein
MPHVGRRYPGRPIRRGDRVGPIPQKMAAASVMHRYEGRERAVGASGDRAGRRSSWRPEVDSWLAASREEMLLLMERPMRYRHLSYRYTMIGPTGPLRLFGAAGRLNVTVAETHWRPETDVYETAAAIVVIVELAGVDDSDVEAMLFEDVLVIEGERRLPSCEGDGVYHAATIRQGPFRVEIALPAAVDPGGLDARCERGLLRITLPKAQIPPPGSPRGGDDARADALASRRRGDKPLA